MRRGVTFTAQSYGAEVARIGSDHSWERPEDATPHPIIERADRAALAGRGLRISWATADHRDAPFHPAKDHGPTADVAMALEARSPRGGLILVRAVRPAAATYPTDLTSGSHRPRLRLVVLASASGGRM